jgi:hypothetical protein
MERLRSCCAGCCVQTRHRACGQECERSCEDCGCNFYRPLWALYDGTGLAEYFAQAQEFDGLELVHGQLSAPHSAQDLQRFSRDCVKVDFNYLNEGDVAKALVFAQRLYAANPELTWLLDFSKRLGG